MTEATAVSPGVIAEQYLDAWRRHDFDAILALHTDDSVFTSVATGRGVDRPVATRWAKQSRR